MSRFDLALSTGQCAVMLRAGLPLSEALRVLIDQAPSLSLERVWEDVHRRVTAGTYLSRACGAWPSVFGNTYLALVRAGESSGRLLQNLQRCADWLERDDKLRRRLRSAATYPLLVTSVALLLTLVLFTTFLPRVFEMFSDGHTPLPALTRLMIALTRVACSPAVWCLSLAGALGLRQLTRRLLAEPGVQQRWYEAAGQVPWLDRILQMNAAARFCGTLASLLDSGLPLLSSWQMAAQATDHPLWAHDAERVRQGVMGGETLARMVAGQPSIYPRGMAGWLQSGEESASLSAACAHMQSVFEGEAEYRLEALSALIEPIFVVFLGSLVTLVLLSVMLPLYGSLSSLGGGGG